MAEEQVQRQEPSLVHEQGVGDHVRAAGVNVLGALGEDEDRVGAEVEDGPHAQDGGPDAVLDVGDEGGVGHHPLVPPAVAGREQGGDVDLVDRGVVLDPVVLLGEGVGVVGEAGGPVGVLEVAEPVGQAEVDQVDDGDDAQAAHLVHDGVEERPVVLAGADPDAVDGGAVAEVLQAEVADELEVGLPQLVVAGGLEFVDADVAGDGGARALDADGEHEPQRVGRVGDADDGGRRLAGGHYGDAPGGTVTGASEIDGCRL